MRARDFAALIVLISTVILGLAFTNLIAFQRSLPNILTAGQLRSVEATETSTITSEQVCRLPDARYLPLDVTLLAYNLHPDKGALDGALRFHPVAKYRKTTRGFERKVTPPDGLVFPRGSRVRVEITNDLGSHYETFSFPTSRLKVFTLSKPTRGVLKDFRFSVLSWSRMYPKDRYLLGMNLDIFLIEKNREKPRQRLAVRCGVGMGAGMMEMVADAQLRSARKPGFILDIKRRAATQRFVWLVVASPLIFALIILHGLIFRSLTSQSLGIGTGLALLSVFSLRAVLVPPGLGGVTLVDAVLAAEVAAMTALSAAAYFLESFRS